MRGENEAPFKTDVLTTLFSNNAARLEIEAGQAADGHRGDLQSDPEARPERFTHARHSGGVVELDQDPNLVELAIPEDLDLELLDRGEAPHDPLDGRGEDVDATDDEHVVQTAEDTAWEAPEAPAARAVAVGQPHPIAGPVADHR